MEKFCSRSTIVFAVICCWLVCRSPAASKPLYPGNILVVLGEPTGGFDAPSNKVSEFTTTGALIQSIPFEYEGPNNTLEFLRDIVVDNEGQIEAVNGFYNPILNIYSPVSGDFTDTIFPDWHNESAAWFGRLATYEDLTFVADNDHDIDPTVGGVRRLDRATGVQSRLAGHGRVVSVTIGGDGKLYALYGDDSVDEAAASSIDVYNPAIGAWLYSIDLPDTVKQQYGCHAIAVDKNGEIYGVGGGHLFHLGADGTLKKTVIPVPEFDTLNDIDVDETGQLIAISGKANVLIGTTALTSFSSFNANDDDRVTDWAPFVSFAHHVPVPVLTIPASGTAKLANISTRLDVQTGDQVGIAGFIVSGPDNVNLVIRAVGPSLTLSGKLADPTLELHDGSGALIASNDNWGDTQASQIQATGLAPNDAQESAIYATLGSGKYTAILKGANDATGIGLVEVYALNPTVETKVGNISTRGFVGVDTNVMIGGFIVSGTPALGDAVQVVVRGLGPSLAQAGVSNVLQDPALSIYNVYGTLVGSNNNWQDTQAADLEATGLAPSNSNEGAIDTTLLSGAYTAVLQGNNNGVGNGLIEVYQLQ